MDLKISSIYLHFLNLYIYYVMTCSSKHGRDSSRTFQGHEPYEILVTSIILMETKSSDCLLGGKKRLFSDLITDRWWSM